MIEGHRQYTHIAIRAATKIHTTPQPRGRTTQHARPHGGTDDAPAAHALAPTTTRMPHAARMPHAYTRHTPHESINR